MKTLSNNLFKSLDFEEVLPQVINCAYASFEIFFPEDDYEDDCYDEEAIYGRNGSYELSMSMEAERWESSKGC